jgi:Fe2+ or Zn2+ uptake regulation protein
MGQKDQLDLRAVADRLHENGLRLTPLKRAVLQALLERPALRAEELGQSVDTGADLSPLYRCLAALESAGLVSHLYLGDDARRFFLEQPFRAHHDYVFCTSCSAVQEVECCLNRVAMGGAVEQGYLVQSHQVVLQGLCPQCRGKD